MIIACRIALSAILRALTMQRGRVVAGGAAGAALLTVHAAVNALLLEDPPAAAPVRRRVSVLLPVRDEAHRVEPCLRALLTQRHVADLEILVLDDGSSDDTADLVRRVGGDRVRLLTGRPLPDGWLGKPWACTQLAAAATGGVLVFVDADVVLAPDGIARTVALLGGDRQFVTPYPRLLADGLLPRLVQPLLPWSLLALLPLAVQGRRPEVAVAGGQLLAVDATAYRIAGGHGAVRDRVIEDIEIARAFVRAGFRGGLVDGSALADCRMYDDGRQLRDGYTKSLWAATGSPAGAAALSALFCWLYVVPPLAALRGSRAGLAGYAAAVAGRVVTARRTGGRAIPDALAHPASVGAVCWLAARSWRLRRRGALSWKGRPV